MKNHSAWLPAFIRCLLVLLMGGTAIAGLRPEWFDQPGANWLEAEKLLPSRFWAGAMLAMTVWLATGWKTWRAIFASGLLIASWVFAVALTDPFHNFTQDGAIFFALVAAWLSAGFLGDALSLGGDRDRVAVAYSSAIALLGRIFLGGIFFQQGVRILASSSPVDFARKTYVIPYEQSILPKFTLWIAGISNPFVLTCGGVLLLVGYRTREAACVVMLFLVSIIFGHMLAHPFGDLVDVRDYSLANFAVCAAVYAAAARADEWGVGGFLARRKHVPTPADRE
jgi:uncharacterized membrane protein YphA (DoxX/SURF4 family)